MRLIDPEEEYKINVLLDMPLDTLKSLLKILYAYSQNMEFSISDIDETTRNSFLILAKKIATRISEETIDYSGRKYNIWAKGKRRIYLGFMREPD